MRTAITTLLIGVAASAIGQDAAARVPVVARESFAKAHPAAENVKWSFSKEGMEAEFKENGQATEVLMDGEGRILQTEVEIAANLLPNPIHEYVAKSHPDARIKEGCKITMADGTVKYEAEVGDGKDKDVDLIFDARGGFLAQEMEEDGEDDDGNDDQGGDDD